MIQTIINHPRRNTLTTRPEKKEPAFMDTGNDDKPNFPHQRDSELTGHYIPTSHQMESKGWEFFSSELEFE